MLRFIPTFLFFELQDVASHLLSNKKRKKEKKQETKVHYKERRSKAAGARHEMEIESG